MQHNEKEYSVVIIGQITLDDAVLVDAPVKQDCPGGDGLYALSGAYIWNRGKHGLVVRRGCDFDLDQIAKITGDRVNFDGVVSVPDVPNIHIWNMFDRKGNRYFIDQVWSGAQEYMAPRPEDIPRSYIESSKAVHIAAMPIEWEQELIRAMPLNGTSDLIVQVDPHFEGVYAQHRELWKELLQHITIFQPSELEFTRLFGLENFENVADYIPYLKKITSYGPKVCSVKLGGRGALVYSRETEECYHVPIYSNENVVDVTGCGDTFCGGFITSYIEDGDIFKAAVKASVSASFNIEHYGCMENFSIPYEAVQERFEQFYHSLDKEACRLL